MRAGENEPCPNTPDGDHTVPVHANIRGMPYVLFEVRQDLIANAESANSRAERLVAIPGVALKDPHLDHVGAPAPEVREPRFEPET